MRVITSLFVLFSFCANANANVKIYENDTSILSLEQAGGSAGITSTLYGGSNQSGESSPADCVVKYSLAPEGVNFKGNLIPFFTDVMSYSGKSKSTASFELVGRVMTYVSDTPLDVCPMGTDFIGDYDLVNDKIPNYKTDFDALIKFNYENALKSFRSKDVDAAIAFLEPYMQQSMHDGYYYPDIFNDYGFLLQQAGRNSDAITVLNVVVKNTPKRMVAYLNIADAYWGLGDKVKSSQNYKKYINLMQSSHNDKIPERAFDRSK